jgi:hypothetical protein
LPLLLARQLAALVGWEKLVIVLFLIQQVSGNAL